MKILIILAHPKKGSFNHAIADAALKTLESKGHNVIFHDLYEENFDPILHYHEIPKDSVLESVVQEHCQELLSAEGIIMVHPNWWGMPPAVMKGWIDRVIRAGTAYEFVEGDSGEGVPMGLLNADNVIVFNTSNTPVDREMQVFGDPLETLWKKCIFGLCGVKNFYRKNYGVIVTSNTKQRQKWLEDVKKTVDTVFP